MVSYLPRYCTNCGAANRQQAAFCFACGQSLHDQVDTTPVSSAIVGSLAPNHLLKERYRIVAQIGSGGMGTVYKAKDTLFDDHLVAVKELSQSGLSAQEMTGATTAFKREARLLVGLNHPNLPKVQDYFTDAGRWYLVMDFLEGETLETYLTHWNGGYLPVHEVLDIGIQLCTVLDYLHTRQPPIIFRDLKPANVMRTPDGRLTLIDFGIARYFRPGQAKDTIALGSAGYAAPEQYGKAQTTPRSDIFSLGALLYQLLTGVDPSQAFFQFAPLNLYGQPIPAGLETLLKHMVEKDTRKRPASMDAVKQDLQRIATRVPAKQSMLRPSPLPQKTFIHRLSLLPKAKVMALMGLALLVVFSAGFFGSIGFFSLVNAHTPTTNTPIHATETALIGGLTPATATATAIVFQNMYNNATCGTPALVDSLHDNQNGYGWQEGADNSGGMCAFKGGNYHVSQANIGNFNYCSGGPYFSNFVFEVQMKIIKGDGGGIIFRANTIYNHFYVFLADQNGSYQLFLCTGDQCNKTLINSSSSAINQGLNQTNLVAVIAQNSTIGLYMNHQLIGSVVDNMFSSGQIGVIANSWRKPTEVVYSNAKVWTV